MENHLLFLPWEPHEQFEKVKRTLKDELPRSVDAQYAAEEEWRIVPEKMKRLNQSENSAQLWMWRMIEVKSDAIKNNIA